MPAPRQREQRANDRHQGDHRQRRETHPDHLRRRTEQLDATANIDRHGHPVSMLVAGVRWGGGTSVRDLKIAAGTTMDSDTSLAMYAGHQPSRRAIVAEAADGQSADRSDSLQLPLLFLKSGPAGGRLRRPSSAGCRLSLACACGALLSRGTPTGRRPCDRRRSTSSGMRWDDRRSASRDPAVSVVGRVRRQDPRRLHEGLGSPLGLGARARVGPIQCGSPSVRAHATLLG
jgi:hypothetical protein